MIRRKLVSIVVVLLCFVSLNVASLQDWDVPLIGTEEVNAGVPGCTYALVVCIWPGRYRIEIGCRYLGGDYAIGCDNCYGMCQ